MLLYLYQFPSLENGGSSGKLLTHDLKQPRRSFRVCSNAAFQSGEGLLMDLKETRKPTRQNYYNPCLVNGEREISDAFMHSDLNY